MKTGKRQLRAMMLVLAVTCVAAWSELGNPSFENPGDPEDWFSDQAASWGRWGHWMNRETGWQPTHNGDCLLGYHHWRLEEDSSSGVYQDVGNVSLGEECTFNVYAFKDDDTNAESIELRLETHGGGQTIASHTYRMGDISRGKWKLLTVSGRTPSTGVRVLIIVTPKSGGDRKGSLKFDDASLMCD